MKIIAKQVIEGQHDVTLVQADEFKPSKGFQVVYGFQAQALATFEEAWREYERCCLHQQDCAGF